MKKRFYLLLLIPIAVVFLTAGFVRSSYTNLGEKFYSYQYYSDFEASETGNFFKDSGCSSFVKTIDKPEIVIKCTTQPGRVITGKAFYTPVKVTAVYNGDKSLLGKQLTVIESVNIRYDVLKYVVSEYGYIPLHTNEQYILCLSKKKWNPHKILSDYEKSQYFVAVNSAFGVYSLKNEKQTELIDDRAKKITINSIDNLDIITNSRKILDSYYEVRKQLFAKYKIS